MPTKLKDIFFTSKFVAELARSLKQVYPAFKRQGFIESVQNEEWESKELKERMRHVSSSLHAFLPRDYPEALEVLRQVAPGFQSFDAMVFPDYVECYGLEHWEISLPALAEFTKQASSEFAIRPFLAEDPERAMEVMYDWAGDEDHHVRRLASEGCRPRLPWAMALPQFKKDPSPILPILQKLKDDSSEYVRRSVANNLNDISKDHPEVVLDICRQWYGENKHRDWIVKHACRGLLKAGNQQALRIFGFADPAEIDIRSLAVDKRQLKIGDELRFEFEIAVKTKSPRKVRMEYAVHFVKSNGSLSKKVFQIKEAEFDPGSYPIRRRHSFADRTTRKHYAGDHQLSIIVNGIEKARRAVRLTV
jgi:3-methyladenine DNA glycosylase AlkC